MTMSEPVNHSQLPGDVASKEKMYRSSDIYFSAYLCSLDIPLITTEVEKGSEGAKKVVFIFRLLEPDLQRLKSSYFGGTGTVKARRFVDNIRSLKSMCFV
jgi:hypothetical protein